MYSRGAPRHNNKLETRNQKQKNNVMTYIKDYIKENRERFFEELFGLIRIPSISSEASHKSDMIKCAEHWKYLLKQAGADKAEVMPTKGNPIVYGEKIEAEDIHQRCTQNLVDKHNGKFE